jgi:hypothetical protein
MSFIGCPKAKFFLEWCQQARREIEGASQCFDTKFAQILAGLVPAVRVRLELRGGALTGFGKLFCSIALKMRQCISCILAMPIEFSMIDLSFRKSWRFESWRIDFETASVSQFDMASRASNPNALSYRWRVGQHFRRGGIWLS